MDCDAGFTPRHGLGVDYEGGILHNSARVAILPASIIKLNKVAWRAN